jgi:hypothetical protein
VTRARWNRHAWPLPRDAVSSAGLAMRINDTPRRTPDGTNPRHTREPLLPDESRRSARHAGICRGPRAAPPRSGSRTLPVTRGARPLPLGGNAPLASAGAWWHRTVLSVRRAYPPGLDARPGPPFVGPAGTTAAHSHCPDKGSWPANTTDAQFADAFGECSTESTAMVAETLSVPRTTQRTAPRPVPTRPVAFAVLTPHAFPVRPRSGR